MTTLSQDTLKKAVEIALDVAPWDFYKRNPECIEKMSIVEVDALAAALVRGVDELKGNRCWYCVNSWHNHTKVMRWDADGGETITEKQGPDRTENTINAIVEFAEKTEVFNGS